MTCGIILIFVELAKKILNLILGTDAYFFYGNYEHTVFSLSLKDASVYGGFITYQFYKGYIETLKRIFKPGSG